MLEGSIVDFSKKGAFRLSEANRLVHVLNRITKRHGDTVNRLISLLECCSDEDRTRTAELEESIGKEIEGWNAKVRKLGGVPKGMWLVDMDSGDGYFCWKYPETEVKYWHDYRSGYSARIPLNDLKCKDDKLNFFSDVRIGDMT